jgi:hypothetical protein
MLTWKSMFSPGDFISSYRPKTGLAAASTLVLEFSIVVIPRIVRKGSMSLQIVLLTRFGDRYRLLLHCFVDGDSVLVPHLVKLVDTHYPAVCKDHRSSFKVELSLIPSSMRFPLFLLLPKLTDTGSRWTDAVRPAAEEPFPEV